MSRMREFVKTYVPARALNLARSLRNIKRRKILAQAQGRGELFGAIYKHKMWGGDEADFYSGAGSHDGSFVAPYVAAVSDYIASLPAKPDVADLGCGDFSVGSQIRPLCAGYVAVDVVPELIERNRANFADANVDFRNIDLVEDDLPKANIAQIREVLQHLSNGEVAAILPKLKQFDAVIVTECLPDKPFTPNKDKPAGFDVRIRVESGLVLHEPPFSLQALEIRVLCEVKTVAAINRTTLYRFA